MPHQGIIGPLLLPAQGPGFFPQFQGFNDPDAPVLVYKCNQPKWGSGTALKFIG